MNSEPEWKVVETWIGGATSELFSILSSALIANVSRDRFELESFFGFGVFVELIEFALTDCFSYTLSISEKKLERSTVDEQLNKIPILNCRESILLFSIHFNAAANERAESKSITTLR